MHGAGGVVIRVKEIRVFRNGIAITGHPFFQNKRFKKPGGMSEMPFGWADFRHRLHDAVFRSEIFRQLGAEISDFVKPGEQFFSWRRFRLRTLWSGRSSTDRCDRRWTQVI